MTKHYVQLFTVGEGGDSHVRVWEVDKWDFLAHEESFSGAKPGMEAIIPAEKSQPIADYNQQNSVVFDG